MTSEPITCARRTPSDDEIPGLLEALEACGGNTAAFARERGLAAWKLYEAQRVASRGRRRRPRKRGGEFAEVTVVEERRPASAPFELLLPAGKRLLIPSEFDERALRRLLGVLVSC